MTITALKFFALECRRCFGAGHMPSFKNRDGGVCYSCRGSGQEVYPTYKIQRVKESPEHPRCWNDKLLHGLVTERERELIIEAGKHLKHSQLTRLLKFIPPGVSLSDVLHALKNTAQDSEPEQLALESVKIDS